MKNLKLVVVLATALLMLGPSGLFASSHREAPFITTRPKVDGTDFYMFNSYEAGRTGYVTLIANYQPFEFPQGGPNYYTMDPNALYEIMIDNNGDGAEDLKGFLLTKTEPLRKPGGHGLHIYRHSIQGGPSQYFLGSQGISTC